MFRKIRYLFPVLLLFLVVVAAAQQQVVVTRTDVPPAVLEAFRKAYPNASLDSVKLYMGTQDTLKYYRVLTLNNNSPVEVAYLPSGQFLSSREVIVVDTLPAPVRTVVTEKYPSEQINLIERLLPSDGKTFYKLYLVSPDRRDTVLVSPEGTIIVR